MCSNIGAVVYNNDEKQKGEFLIMTHKAEEEVGFNNNRSFPHWNDLYSNETSIGSLPWYKKDLDNDLKERTFAHYEYDKGKIA